MVRERERERREREEREREERERESRCGMGLLLTAAVQVVWFHGGGFVIGGRDDMFYDHICRRFSSVMRVNVVAVDYRLSPEHKFPAALMDCYSVLHWIAHGESRADLLELIDRDNVIVGGDSAGGTLALGVSALARERGDVPGSYPSPHTM